MATTALDRSLFAALGSLLEYPRAGFVARAIATHDAIVENYPGASGGLDKFLDDIDGKAPSELEELYTRTFDFSPLVNAYVSVHLFGDESFKRSQLMTGLALAYQRAGFDPGAELPDHLAVILRFAPFLTDEEWQDMVRYCLRPAVAKILDPLKRSNNTYQYALETLLWMLDADFPEEVIHV